MIAVRKARTADAVAIAAVHVAAWRNTYPGILPDSYLAKLSVSRQAMHYDRAIRAGTGVMVAIASGNDVAPGNAARIVGFTTANRLRRDDRGGHAAPNGQVLADGEIETLYVLDDWRERGIGRRLLRAAAAWLAEAECRSVFLWVLRDNPSRWFYERMGGRPVAEAVIQVAGQGVTQTAFVWDPIDGLLTPPPEAS